ncbi:MAG: hypothetical protein MJ191_05710 [Clostridium sp.]|nr:hypothetical protein [Clostridium sp.]
MKQRKTTYTVKKELTNDAWNRELYKDRPLDPKNFTDKDYFAKEITRYDSESDVNIERSAGSRIHSIGAYSIAGVCGFIFALLMAICVYRVVVLDSEPLSIMDFLNYAETIDIIPFDDMNEWFNGINDAINSWGSSSLGSFKFIVALPLTIINIIRVLGVIISGVYYLLTFVFYLIRLTLW